MATTVIGLGDITFGDSSTLNRITVTAPPTIPSGGAVLTLPTTDGTILVSSNGNLTLSGTITGGTINGTTITGGTIDGAIMQYDGIAMPRMVQVHGLADTIYAVPSWVTRITMTYFSLSTTYSFVDPPGMIVLRLDDTINGERGINLCTVSQFAAGTPPNADTFGVAGFGVMNGFPFVNTTDTNRRVSGVLTLTKRNNSSSYTSHDWMFNATSNYNHTGSGLTAQEAAGRMAQSIGYWHGNLASLTITTSNSSYSENGLGLIPGNVSITYEG